MPLFFYIAQQLPSGHLAPQVMLQPEKGHIVGEEQVHF